jgi:RNA polymerase sigma-70 factor (ECF subfamily)
VRNHISFAHSGFKNPRKTERSPIVMVAEDMDGAPDKELVLRFRRGETAAFDALVARYVRLAGAVAYAVLGDFEAAADVVQEAFLKVHGALAELREPEKFKGWLHGVVRTTALDALRKQKRARSSSLEAIEGHEDLVPDAARGPAPRAEKKELEERVLRAIQGLPENYREVVIMKYLDERSYKEIAETLGITVETIESRLFRARKLLKSALVEFADLCGEA